MSTHKLFTKSAFKVALNCLTQLYCYNNDNEYEDTAKNDPTALENQKDGYIVGAAAKLKYGIEPDHDLSGIWNIDDAINKTNELLKNKQIRIAEAAFQHGKCYVRADILIKDGDKTDIYEVKAKTFKKTDKLINSKSNLGEFAEYVLDAAFQKWVIQNSLGQKVEMHLVMVNPDAVEISNGLYFRFHVNKADNSVTIDKADEIKDEISGMLITTDEVLQERTCDDICEQIITGRPEDICRDIKDYNKWFEGKSFKDFVTKAIEIYCNNKSALGNAEWKNSVQIGKKCFECQYRLLSSESEKKAMAQICWLAKGFEISDDFAGTIHDIEINKRKITIDGANITADINEFFNRNHIMLSDMTRPYLIGDNEPHIPLDQGSRNMLIVGMACDNPEFLEPFRRNIADGVYLDKDGLRQEMNRWKYPLHMIDFEDCAPTLPIFHGMQPNQQIAFQFSHHVIDKHDDGTYSINHMKEFLNTDLGKCPHIDFIIELYNQLKDGGTVFCYSDHENGVLRKIRKELYELKDEVMVPEKKELIRFIDSITHYTKDELKALAQKIQENNEQFDASSPWRWENINGTLKLSFRLPNNEWYKTEITFKKGIKTRIEDTIKSLSLPAGGNDMVDLEDLVKKYFYHPDLKKFTSIKKVMPAVLNISETLKKKYSQPIYGTEIHSDNFDESSPYAWVELDKDGKVINPYDKLKKFVTEGTATQNGGMAPVTYKDILSGTLNEEETEGKRKELLRYCELDTMSMVWIWEYFHNECFGKKQ